MPEAARLKGLCENRAAVSPLGGISHFTPGLRPGITTMPPLRGLTLPHFEHLFPPQICESSTDIDSEAAVSNRIHEPRSRYSHFPQPFPQVLWICLRKALKSLATYQFTVVCNGGALADQSPLGLRRKETPKTPALRRRSGQALKSSTTQRPTLFAARTSAKPKSARPPAASRCVTADCDRSLPLRRSPAFWSARGTRRRVLPRAAHLSRYGLPASES